ncbi:MAG: peptidylprolyl isomerase [Thermodesulfovibrionales bacterium]
MSFYSGYRKHFFIALVLAFALSVSNLSYGLVSDRLLATVKDEPITLSDYQRFVLLGTGHKEDNKPVDESLLKKMIEEKLILHEALRRNIEASDAEVDVMIKEYAQENSLSQDALEKEISQNDMNVQSFRKLMKEKLITQKLILNDVDAKVIVTDKEIETFYNEHKKDYLNDPEKVEVKAIFLRLPDDASATELTDMKRRTLWIEAQLKDGANFDRLAEKYSDEPLKSQGGRLGEFTKNAIIPPLGSKAFSMNTGEISEPIWVRDGVYILYLANKTNESFTPLRDVSGGIKEQLFKLKKEQVFNEWMKALWERVSVTIN